MKTIIFTLALLVSGLSFAKEPFYLISVKCPGLNMIHVKNAWVKPYGPGYIVRNMKSNRFLTVPAECVIVGVPNEKKK